MTAHRSNMNTASPGITPPNDPALPPELGWTPTAYEAELERLLRHRIRLIDLTVARGNNFYYEGLSFQHSYPRAVRRMTADAGAPPAAAWN